MNEYAVDKYFVLERYSDSMFVLWSSPSKQKYLGDIIFDISCGWVYCADEDNTGYYTSGLLRSVADKLDELNAELFKEMSEPMVTQC